MSEGPDPTGQHRRSTGSSESDSVAEVFNRFTLDSGRRGWRRKRAQKDPGPQAETELTTSEPASPAGPSPSNASAVEAPWPHTGGPGAPAPSHEPGSPGARDASSTDETMSTSIRPYAWTGGRTRSNHHLELETLVSASEFCTPERLRRTEHHSISEICQHPRSIAEVGAMLGVPFGVAKVLVGDMADLGLITVHETVSDNSSSSHFLLMERVLSGLRRL
ncbi:uncharacterized protein DUF742 [Saccharopolyspora dendranthemae]|uniref:Uncharacterized protein DUF742 n=2 Tax=Saccharopolyspora dendranthemae TaxID=1181886 RepID=A0A561VC12_9PSEU|nr:uncharacterized protein DUF742 [Saccharopolyspora dendranthemae]